MKSFKLYLSEDIGDYKVKKAPKDYPADHHEVHHHKHGHIGSIHSYSAYSDKKAKGSRIVMSRKNVRRWAGTLKKGQHQIRMYRNDPIYPGDKTEMRFGSKKDALEWIARNHRPQDQ